MGEQRRQVRVGQFVIDNKSGVDGNRSLRPRDRDGVRMAADAMVTFIDRDVMALTEQPSRRNAAMPVQTTAILFRLVKRRAPPFPAGSSRRVSGRPSVLSWVTLEGLG